MESLVKCPVCGNPDFKTYLNVSDYFLTRENFSIVSCDHCSFRFTNPRPDASELGKYYESKDYISHSNTRSGLFSFVYQNIRKFTIASKYRLIKRFAKGTSILDIGCATGEFLKYFKNRGWKTIGVEPNEKAREFAHSVNHLDVKDEEWLKTAPEQKFNIVTLWHVLEHVPAVNGRLEEIKNILKDDGYVFIAVPNADSPDATYYKEHWAGYDVPRHLYHFTVKTMEMILTKHGFQCIEKIPMKFDSFYVSLLSEKYLQRKNHWIRAFISGIRSNVKAKRGNNYSSMIFVAKKQENFK